MSSTTGLVLLTVDAEIAVENVFEADMLFRVLTF